MQLDLRAQTLLKALVERYIADGQPVGSRELSKISGLELSPATIRNVMSDLEELGLVASPHTSAGRVPTSRAYRVFVDELITIEQGQGADWETVLHQKLHAHQASAVMGNVAIHSHQLVSNAVQMVSSLSHFAGIVMTSRQESIFKQVEFVRLSEKKVLLVIVTPNDEVHNSLLMTQVDYSPSQLAQAAHYLNQHCGGLSFTQARQAIMQELRELKTDMDALMLTALEVGDEALSHNAEEVIIAGERNLLSVSDYVSNMNSLRQLFDIFEQKKSLMQLLDVSCHASGVKIFIGGESNLVPMEEMSVITAPYHAKGKVVGTLGVIGPTRMAYEKVIPIVDITAKLLSSALNSTDS